MQDCRHRFSYDSIGRYAGGIWDHTRQTPAQDTFQESFGAAFKGFGVGCSCRMALAGAQRSGLMPLKF